MRHIRFLKYFAGFTIPLSAYLSMYYAGYFSYLTLFYAFGFLPALEFFLPVVSKNISLAEEEIVKKDKVYDWLLYLNVPIQFFITFYFLNLVTMQEYQWWEIVGLTSALGICCGVLGINVAHELGHRVKKIEILFAKSLLLTSLYMHFYIEHNRGHHKNVSTDDDPASAKLNEPVYTFWIRTIFYSAISAWKLETKRLEKKGKNVLSLHNQMLQYILIQGLFLIFIALFFSVFALILFVVAAFIGILLLETINYVEHYGLRRKKTPEGYERVMPWHSWNSNHYIGRICLYELTRHSDHHYLASKKYQILSHLDDAPQLPAGYPAMMLLTLFPPIWFFVMNKKVKTVMAAH
ncbi:MAG: alkane 1-monooxygenase [Chitinophagales bacterium]